MAIWGVLPVKDFRDAKTRLAPVLSPDERRALFPLMVEDVLVALTAAHGLAGVLVLTRDPEAAALARRRGARVLAEPKNRGQTAAVTRACATLEAEGAAGILALPGDIPLATTAEIEAALAAHRPAPAVTIVPAWDERGSNCMVCSPPTVIPFAFGNDSFAPHKAAARARGIEPTIVALPGIGLDVDNPRDLRMALARGGTSRALDWLTGSGIAARLEAVDDASA
jgi:2-phospho-L-lactate/phosphoenolpyruvate guanylyltransferase